MYESLRNENDTNHSASTLSQTYHCDRMLVDFDEKEDGSVVLAPSTRKKSERNVTSQIDKWPRYKGVPLGRAIDCPTLTPRASEDDRLDRRRRPFVKLAVVGMAYVTEEDESKEKFSSVLITRRPSYMRSFPGAFVFPGGNVDDEDESLEHALSREFFEETGLTISEDSWKLECLWESIYPTHLPDLPELDTAATATYGNDGISHQGAIKAHHMVCYYSGKLETQNAANPSLNLCQEEVDGAVWMSRDNIQDLLEATALIEGEADSGLPDILKDQTIVLQTNSSSTKDLGNDIPLSDLAGIYPRFDKISKKAHGMAQGSLFALEEFIRRH